MHVHSSNVSDAPSDSVETLAFPVKGLLFVSRVGSVEGLQHVAASNGRPRSTVAEDIVCEVHGASPALRMDEMLLVENQVHFS